ncbi:serine/threonine-protein kinase Ksp1p [[Candida] railenensis]|uniref:non-specific serine/threonine protein kinase n=1 Tax=[Candida] railenensis TaxID=45579 RepID=A0A9P0VXG5_9ASCO|nr:serine/threonine-protein kinase Ksp1p [[Candida] railenensis]
MEAYNNYNKGDLLKGQYRKLADLSKGSYGLVSVAEDIVHDKRLVAVKYIYPLPKKKQRQHGSDDDDSDSDSDDDLYPLAISPPSKSILQTLYNEAKKEITIHKILGVHSNIATLYDHFDSCLVLEYCSRGDLYDAIQDGKGPSTSQDIKDVFYQILDALEFCHSKNVFHRDLKPENILIGEDWSIKLCDWGLATTNRIISNKSEFDVGSERYMAPELFDPEMESYDAAKIDLWSIGIILLTLVFHKNPFSIANHSDKRFLQFVVNREALFDIFSTMSGEMFSVLRYSLNIDPTNRDIGMLKGELETLKYFTIDEEYWEVEQDEVEKEPHYEGENELGNEEEEDEEEEDEVDDEVQLQNNNQLEFTFDVEDGDSSGGSGGSDRLAKSNSGRRSRPPIRNRNLESALLGTYDSEGIDSAAESDVTASSDAALPMPHNHRADALLSKNSSMLPIPIIGTEYNDVGNHSIFRNQRKPFGVASFNQSKISTDGFGGGKFNREDFFTPKSVFNHYMDKYGDSKQQDRAFNYNSNNNNHNVRNKMSTWKKKGKRRSWKKATIDSDNYESGSSSQFPRSRSRSRVRHSYSGTNHTNVNGNSNGHVHGHGNGNGNSRDYFKKKAHSFSSSKPKKLFSNSGHSNLAATSGGNSQLHQHHGIHTQQLQQHPSLQNNGVVGSKKYVPPYLRSPSHARSPLIDPPIEDIGNLNLEDDEVFHLEDDFDDSEYPSNNGHISGQSSGRSHGTFLIPTANTVDNFKKPPINFKVPTYSLATAVGVAPGSTVTSDSSSVRGIGRRNSLGGGQRSSVCPTSSSGKFIGPISEFVPPNGKYVPPFRRSSHSSNITSKIKANEGNSKECDDDSKRKMSHHDFKRDIMTNIDSTSSSVPTGKTDWFSFKKDWGDYDDEDA